MIVVAGITKRLIEYNFTADSNKPEYIVVHDTGNRDVGANAIMHYNYFNVKGRKASAHFFVDDSHIIQCIEVKDSAWHCGDGWGSRGITNNNSIGVEMCINRDGNYAKAFDNTANLVAYLMKQYNIGIDKVVRHYDASGKNCPQTMNNNGDWTAWNCFKNLLKGRGSIMAEVDPIYRGNVDIVAQILGLNSPEYWYNHADKNVHTLITLMADYIRAQGM
jgi:N-acetylmuramoyl-L-alanine amidase CwlA